MLCVLYRGAQWRILFLCVSASLDPPPCMGGGSFWAPLSQAIPQPWAFSNLRRAPPTCRIVWEHHRKALEQRDMTPKIVSEGDLPRTLWGAAYEPSASPSGSIGDPGEGPLWEPLSEPGHSGPYAFRKPNMLIWVNIIQSPAHFLCVFTCACPNT